MDLDEPSLTALTAAAARAAHLIVDDEPRIFADVLAAPLLSDRADDLISYHRAHGTHVVLSGARAQVVCRSRYCEDRLVKAVRGGLAQYVILGAGLDSFAYRSELTTQLRVFEVDHPATQDWKRKRVADARVKVPDTVSFVPVNPECESPAPGLIAAGFDPKRPALVSWLGVTMYLTRTAIGETLTLIAGLATGTEVILDYMVPAGLRDAAGDTYVELVMPATAERGEPWLSFFAPAELSELIRESGLVLVEHVWQRDAVDPALGRVRLGQAG